MNHRCRVSARRTRSTIVAGVVLLLAVGSGVARAVDAPYPPSLFGEIQWHETLTLETGLDNYPTTWADDNHVYTAGGDGAGFGTLRGNWICRVLGKPPRITGENVSMISTGSGGSGKKGSGLLSIDGTLYLWARNADGAGREAQLAVSTDHGETWAWGPTFPELGYPTFINFGKDYAGARDVYVYTVSNDDPSAYTPANHFILLRAPAQHVMNRSAYEYFVSTDATGAPIWSSDPEKRGPVFTHVQAGQGRCARSGMNYQAAIGRYLWWQQYPHDGGSVDTRFAGGFGIYDAPEPWGPWTTMYFTTAWDQGPGDGGSFCSKYTVAHGKTMWLLFSGNDNLRLRRATLQQSVATGVAAPPADPRRWQPAPNPFTSGTRAAFRLSRAHPVRIDVRDVHGRPVVRLLDRVLDGGVHSVEWDGRDHGGARVAAGVYFLRLEVGETVETRRVVRLR